MQGKKFSVTLETLFPIKNLEPKLGQEPKPKYRKLSLKLSEDFLNEFINEEKKINEEIFRNYLKHQIRSFVVKDLFKADKSKNNKITYIINNELIKLMEHINIKKIPEK